MWDNMMSEHPTPALQGFLGSGGETRTLNQRINSPFQRISLTGGNA